MVEPTNLKPRFFSALERASEAGVVVGISASVAAWEIYLLTDSGLLQYTFL